MEDSQKESQPAFDPTFYLCPGNTRAGGASNPHPHGQVWANENIPNEPQKELNFQGKYYEKMGRSLLSDYLQVEPKSEI